MLGTVILSLSPIIEHHLILQLQYKVTPRKYYPLFCLRSYNVMCLSTACEAALTQAKQFKQFTFLSVATGICLLIIYTFFDQAKFF